MQQLITRNLMPVKKEKGPFCSVFEEQLSQSDEVRIACGYISAEAMTEIRSIVEMNPRIRKVEIIIGMHKFDGFTQQQLEASQDLHKYLQENKRGCVRICTTFPYHGKIYIFSKQGNVISGLIGSSNLSSLMDDHDIYEVDVLVKEPGLLGSMDSLVGDLAAKASKEIDEIQPADFKIIKTKTRVLENIVGVEMLLESEVDDVKRRRTHLSFEIPVKAEAKSNLNPFFGAGRRGRNGLVKPRPWYEAEIIVSKAITDLPGYPDEGSVFSVVTDDGWRFDCNVNGQNKKNFRSKENLQILGRWLKGRLEEDGCLRPGERVTEQVLAAYGRDSFTLAATDDPSVWFLDFSK